MREFFARWDLIIAPTTAIPPFPVELPFPTDVAGKPMTSYIEWLLPTYCFTVVGVPAITVPCGFTTTVYDRARSNPNAAPASREATTLEAVPAKLPVGVDFLGRPFSEPTLLKIAAAYERATKHRRPPPGFGPVAGEP